MLDNYALKPAEFFSVKVHTSCYALHGKTWAIVHSSTSKHPKRREAGSSYQTLIKPFCFVGSLFSQIHLLGPYRAHCLYSSICVKTRSIPDPPSKTNIEIRNMYRISIFLLLQFVLTTLCLPAARVLSGRQTNTSTTTPLVFAHYMLMSQPPNADYSTDIKLAQAAGIDAFALNYGSWNHDFETQDGYLESFYKAVNTFNLANNASFKLFISVDLTSVGTTEQVISLFNKYSTNTAQLKVDNKAFFSSFQVAPPPWYAW